MNCLRTDNRGHEAEKTYPVGESCHMIADFIQSALKIFEAAHVL
jgi:hypothetical protein